MAGQSIAVVLRSLPLAAICRRLPLAAGRPPQMENEDYVVAAAAGAADTRGARSLRRDAVRHREWRTERIGALCHRVAVRASATESGAEEYAPITEKESELAAKHLKAWLEARAQRKS